MRKDKRMLLYGILLIIMSVTVAGSEVSDAVKARLLEKRCTQKTEGTVCENGWLRVNKIESIDYFVAEYMVDGVFYQTKGMGTGRLGEQVSVRYDPRNVSDAYAGDSPIKEPVLTVFGNFIGAIALTLIGILMVNDYKK